MISTLGLVWISGGISMITYSQLLLEIEILFKHESLQPQGFPNPHTNTT